MALIHGIHHAAMKCAAPGDYERVVAFYGGALGLPVAREWNNGIMFDTGSGLIEIFRDGEHPMEKGVIRHFALATEDVDACVRAVTEAGYPVFMGPKEICIPSEIPFPARVAFCTGPLGEEIEFFQER